MSASHKNLKIRAEKEAVRARIQNLEDQAKAVIRRVPQKVLDGSHQLAVAWKHEAERYQSRGVLIGGSGDSTSLERLKHLEQIKKAQLDFLSGETTSPWGLKLPGQKPC